VVEHAVLAAATIAERVDDPVAADRMRQLVRGKLLGLTPAGLARMWMSSPPDIFTGLAGHRTAFDEMAAIVTRHRFDELTGRAMRQAFTAVQTDDRLATISARLTLIQGSEDMPRFVEYARRLERVVPRCRTAFVPAAGHLPLQERPDDCLPLLREALATFPRPSGLTS
jgi:pimeloyl-ACP methyl ester carboxylesterase